LAEIKNIKLNTNNNIKQYIHQRFYQVTNNIYGNPKSLNEHVCMKQRRSAVSVKYYKLNIYIRPHVE